MTATQKCRGSERDIFNVDFTGFDTHSNVEVGLQDLFHTLNEALTTFSSELKKQGKWNDVAIVVTSDFGR